MQRWIDIAEWKREKIGMSIKTLVAGICDPSSYDAYKRNRSQPGLEIMNAILTRLKINHFVADESITISLKPTDWALISLYYDGRHQDVFVVYSRVFGHNFRPDALFYMACKLALFITFHFWEQSSLPSRSLLEDQFVGMYEVPFLKNKAEEYGMINMISEPTKLMHQFYEELIVDIDEYLTNGGIRYKING